MRIEALGDPVDQLAAKMWREEDGINRQGPVWQDNIYVTIPD